MGIRFGLLPSGEPPPTTEERRLTAYMGLRMTRDDIQAATRAARQKGMTTSAFVRLCVREAVRKHPRSG
jgi:hypothetical protein